MISIIPIKINVKEIADANILSKNGIENVTIIMVVFLGFCAIRHELLNIYVPFDGSEMCVF